jgi:co-chaperonin GroES (HSP10)
MATVFKESHEEVAPVSDAPEVFERSISEFASLTDLGIKLDELPRPTLWRVLVLPKQPKKMTASGIALPTAALEAERHLNFIGQVLALGPLAGKTDKFQNPEWQPTFINSLGFREARTPEQPRWAWNIKVGDWVVYGRYAGMAKEYKGVRLLTVNDDEITEVIDGPDNFRVYV